MDEPLLTKQYKENFMEHMLLGTGIFMLSMMTATLIFSRLFSRRAEKLNQK
jgi:hypothetical protein